MPRPPHRVLSLFTPGGPPDVDGQAAREGEGDDAQRSSHEPRPQSVSQLMGYVGQFVRREFVRVFVEGELSQIKPYGQRAYFRLKDQNAFVSCVIGGPTLARLAFDLEDGLFVQVRGRLNVFRSQVQLDVAHIEPAGIGALALAFEQTKQKLAAEGVFDSENKRPLPLLPRTVGIVTSKRGAAVRDMLKVLRLRMPGVSILLSPTRVQGREAAPDIIEALLRLDRSRRCDVILLGRGGGSLEDLWAFNDEHLVRAIKRCTTPVIAAVGHETDTTLTCLAADLRAATPSHAAESAVPVLTDLLRRIARDAVHLEQRTRAHIDRAHLRLRRAEKRLGDPSSLLRPAERRLTSASLQLEEALERRLRRDRARLEALSERLAHRAPDRTLQERRQRTVELKERLLHASPRGALVQEKRRLERARERMTSASVRRRADARRALVERAAKLHALSPLAVLDRGYALVRHDDDERAVVRSSSALSPGDRLRVRLSDGEVRAEVSGHLDDADGESAPAAESDVDTSTGKVE